MSTYIDDDSLLEYKLKISRRPFPGALSLSPRPPTYTHTSLSRARARSRSRPCSHLAQVLDWFLNHQEENRLILCRIKNKFAFSDDELVSIAMSNRDISLKLLAA